MDYSYSYGQCSDPNSVGSHKSDDEVILASSCPKKKAGRKKFKETRHPVYRGVRQRNGNRWVCEVRTPNNSRIWLGTYPTADMAARAHDVAALALRGRHACLNFADSAWRLRVPGSTDPAEIQRAAAEAAEAFGTQESEVADDNGVMRDGDGYNGGSSGVNQMENEYVDEEAVFDMPTLLANMAEGMLLPPPQHPYDSFSWDDNESDCEVSLWSHSA